MLGISSSQYTCVHDVLHAHVIKPRTYMHNDHRCDASQGSDRSHEEDGYGLVALWQGLRQVPAWICDDPATPALSDYCSGPGSRIS